jgi:hypothetical protein
MLRFEQADLDQHGVNSSTPRMTQGTHRFTTLFLKWGGKNFSIFFADQRSILPNFLYFLSVPGDFMPASRWPGLVFALGPVVPQPKIARFIS